MKNIIIIIIALSINSCGFQHINFNSEQAKSKGAKTGDLYNKELVEKGEIEGYELVTVENAMLYVGKNKDTIKEVYKLIYKVNQKGISKNQLLEIKKTDHKFNAKYKQIN